MHVSSDPLGWAMEVSSLPQIHRRGLIAALRVASPAPKIASGEIFPGIPTVLPTAQFELDVRQLDDGSLTGKLDLGFSVVNGVVSSRAWVVPALDISISLSLFRIVGSPDDDEAAAASSLTFRTWAIFATVWQDL